MKTRVLHVATAMGRGGLEVWLMSVLRNIDRSRYQLDFLVQTQDRALFDEEIVASGSKLIRCARGGNIFAFARAFLNALKREGPYDIVHTHLHHYSAIVAFLSRLAGVKSVIAHSHSVAYANRDELPFGRRAYLRLTEWMIRMFCDVGLGCSAPAYGDLFPVWQTQGRQNVLLCGIDLEPYARAIQAAGPQTGARGVPKTIVHVGRFTTPKNHGFLLEVLAELARLREDFNVLLVGSGPLRPRMEKRVDELGLKQRVVFAGDRNDVPHLLVQSDLFIFPSLYEGLGLALVEAQAAGLGCVISGSIPDEAVVVKSQVRRLRLDAGARAWAHAVSQALDEGGRNRAECLQQVRAVFDIQVCVTALCALYDRLTSR